MDSMANDIVLIKSKGRMYRIPRSLFEPTAQVYERGWYLVEQTKASSLKQMTPEKINQWINQSFEWMHSKQGMGYES
jgi:hypothetical protein